MRSNLNGLLPISFAHYLDPLIHFSVLVNNLRVHVKPMYQLYCVLKDREEAPTPDEIAIAMGKKQLDGRTEAEYLKRLENASENIKKAFEDQQAWAAVSDNIFLTCTPH
jgi:hypothetical protein